MNPARVSPNPAVRQRTRPRQPNDLTDRHRLPHLRQDLPDHRRVIDAGGDHHRPAAGLTGLNIDKVN